METMDAISSLWPVFTGFITLVIVLAKQHNDTEILKEKVKTLFDLYNSKK